MFNIDEILIISTIHSIIFVIATLLLFTIFFIKNHFTLLRSIKIRIFLIMYASAKIVILGKNNFIY